MSTALRYLLFLLTLTTSYATDPSAESPILRKITSIRIPKIRVETASATEMFSFVGQEAWMHDPEPDPAMRGVSYLTKGFISVPQQTVHYSRDNIQVGRVLQDIANLFHVDIHITSVGVVMTPHKESPFPNTKAKTGKIFRTFTSLKT